MKKLCIILVLFLAGRAWSSPQMFGLEMNTPITEATLTKQFGRFAHRTIKLFDGTRNHPYDVYELPVHSIGFQGLNELKVILDSDHKIVCIDAYFDKKQYDKLSRILKQKYILKNEKKPFVGDRMIYLTQDDTRIYAFAPHLSFKMHLYYAQTDFFMIESQHNQIEKDKRSQSESNYF